ncbi:MAG: exosortase [Candidatus Marinimicrobia bacterium]|nr:exosortase [Candidatus Neomarinimicrobiota bacterium]
MATDGNRHIWNERLGLAALDPLVLARLGIFALTWGLLYIMFYVYGSYVDVERFGRSAIGWLINRWNYGGDFSHGYLIPFVTFGLLWVRRHELAEAPKRVSGVGLAVIVLALALHWLGAKAEQTRLSLTALIMLFWGIPFYLYGWHVAKVILFPVAYLMFCLPWQFLENSTLPLRMMAAWLATGVLNGLGLESVRQGSAIYSSVAGGFSFDVADPCSGLRSIVAMTALTAVYANLTQRTLLKKWLLFLCAAPIAVLGNMMRIVTIAMVAQAFGNDVAVGLYHDYSGYIIFAVGITAMVSFGAILNSNWREVFAKWKQSLLHPVAGSAP